MRAHPLSDAIIEVGVEEFLGLHRLIGIAQQALGEDQRMALVVVGTNHLLNGMANHVDVDGTRTVVLCEVDPIGVLHVDRVFPQLEELLHQILLILLGFGNRPRGTHDISVGVKSKTITQLLDESRH